MNRAGHLRHTLPARKKVMIRGNHDYWHTSLAKTRAMLDEHTFFLQNDCVEIGGAVFAGARGWQQEDADRFDSNDRKIYDRELGRLRMSLEAAAKKKKPIIVLIHFPLFPAVFQNLPLRSLSNNTGFLPSCTGIFTGRRRFQRNMPT